MQFLAYLLTLQICFVIGFAKEGEFVYSDSTSILEQKKTNLYWIDEISNVCVINGKASIFALPDSQVIKAKEVFSHGGLPFDLNSEFFSQYIIKNTQIEKKAVSVLLYSSSIEQFQPYRLTNALIYLKRNEINTNIISSVYMNVSRKQSSISATIYSQYNQIISTYLGSNLHINQNKDFCSQQLILISPCMDHKDVIYQLDSVYIRKAIYKGKPEYPISPRKPVIQVNLRKEVPMWKDSTPVLHYFTNVYTGSKSISFITLSEMTNQNIIQILMNCDIFVTVYGEETAFIVFMVPYSVLIEVMPDYYNDSTTSIMAYAADIYPVILRDVYSEIPKECEVQDELVLSEREPCRSILLKRPITFDVKSMTHAMTQTTYYLNNYKMKVVKY